MASRSQESPAIGLAAPAASHNVVAKVAYAPTIQTTVVTTTTTTTTSFPPFIMPAPRNLLERDPEVYPLAATPTPQELRKIHFQINGQTAEFEEADNGQDALQEVCLNHKVNIIPISTNNGLESQFRFAEGVHH